MYPNLINEMKLSEILGVSSNTLRKWRWEGKGPQFIKLGSKVAYRQADVDKYIEGNLFSSTTECDEAKNDS